jgi:hypothetical protein
VQGRLRGERLQVRIESECAHCARPLSLEVNEELRWRVLSPGASPLLFEPTMNWDTFRAPNIVHDY